MNNARQALIPSNYELRGLCEFFEIFPTSVVLEIKWALSKEFDEHSVLQGSGELVFAFHYG